MDAIFDKMAEKPDRSQTATTIFRAKALDQLDVAADVDSQLPLVSRRNWLLLAGLGVLVLAFAVWASLTPSVTSVSAPGRAVGGTGVVTISAPATGVIEDIAATGTEVAVDQKLATLRTGDGQTPVISAVQGTVWQQFESAGETAAAGGPLLSLLPPGSGDQVLLVVPESQAAGMAPGMKVSITSQGITAATLASLSSPMSAQEVTSRTGLTPANGSYVLAAVALPVTITPGAPANGTVVLSDGTVLSRLLGRS